MAELDTARPLCAEVSAAAGEPLEATASRVEHWLLVEYGGHWPYDPLDAAVFAGTLRDRIAEQLRELRNSRLLLIKRPGRGRRDRVEVVYGSTPERGGRFWRLELDHHADLGGLDLPALLAGGAPARGEPLDHPLLLVCTHGTRDRCCAKYGQVLCRSLHRHAPEGWVRQASHVGGDRFAGNVVCLPEGIYLGRVRPAQSKRVLAEYLEGRIELDAYRGRSCYPFPLQAAEIEVRRRTGLRGFHDLRLARPRTRRRPLASSLFRRGVRRGARGRGGRPRVGGGGVPDVPRRDREEPAALLGAAGSGRPGGRLTLRPLLPAGSRAPPLGGAWAALHPALHATGCRATCLCRFRANLGRAWSGRPTRRPSVPASPRTRRGSTGRLAHPQQPLAYESAHEHEPAGIVESAR